MKKTGIPNVKLTNRLQPAVSRLILSERLARLNRQLHSLSTFLPNTSSNLQLWYQVDDPWSVLCTQLLPQFLDKLRCDVDIRLIPMPGPEAYPEPDMWRQQAINDARIVASAWGLEFHYSTPPDPTLVPLAEQALIKSNTAAEFLQQEPLVREALWRGNKQQLESLAAAGMPAEQTNRQLRRNAKLQRRSGHYRGGMWAFQGEWFDAVDRLKLLEERLTAAGMLAETNSLASFDATAATLPTAPDNHDITLFYSFRSPYSWVSIPQIRGMLADQPQARLNIRPVLPMVMRGLPVPLAKKLYIIRDAAREARRQNIPFGRVIDPVGSGVERALAVFPYANDAGRGLDFLDACGQASWAEGKDLADDNGLRWAVERCDLDWGMASALVEAGQIDYAEDNRKALFSLGHWGVPTLQHGEVAVWGQDRVWVIREMLRRELLQSH